MGRAILSKSIRRRGLTVAGVAACFVALRLVAPGSTPSPSAPPTPSPARTTLGETPRRLGTIFLCPLDAPYRAFAASRRFFPPNYPAPPAASARPSRCFGSAEEARLAGYGPAPVPGGALLVGGVFLLPTDATLRSRCAAAAGRLRFAVPCPAILPGRQIGAGPVRCGLPNVEEARGCVFRDFFSRAEWFALREGAIAVPPEYRVGPSTAAATNTLLLTAYRARDERHVDSSFYFVCPHHLGVTSTAVRGRKATWATCGGNGYEAMLTLRWVEPFPGGDVVVRLSIQADTPVNRSILSVVGRRVRMVPPAD